VASFPGLQELFETGKWRDRAVEVKRNRRQTILRIPAQDGLPSLYVKEDAPRHLRDRVKTLWRWKAREEYLSALDLEAAGIPVVAMLGWGIASPNSLLVSLEAPNAVPFSEKFQEIRHLPELRLQHLTLVADFINRMIRAGIAHPDLHAGNILIQENAGGPNLLLADAEGVRCGVPLRERMLSELLCMAFSYRPQLTPEESSIVRETLLANTGIDDPLLAKCQAEAEKRRERNILGFLKRHHQGSSLCHHWRNAQGEWICRKKFLSPAQMGDLMASLMAGQAENIKDDIKRRVSRLQDPAGQSWIVKEYRNAWWRRLCSWRRPDLICWDATLRLERLTFPVARMLGWLRAGNNHGFIIMEDVGRNQFRPGLNQLPADEAKTLAAGAGKLLARLHNKKIFHPDFKAANLMLRPEGTGGGRIFLIDCDQIWFRRPITLAMRRRNLGQFIGDADDQWLAPELLQAFLNGYLNGIPPALRPAMERKLSETPFC
jgi:tRNA A-37 threonylcarbamoyl transferase component Bud32